MWLHDKQSGKSHPAPIDKVAQSKGYYSPEVEEALRQVEGPANVVMAKLVNNEMISSTERMQLTLYVAVALKRVPYRRRKALEMFPGVLDNTLKELRAELTQAAAKIEPPVDDERLRDRLDEIENIFRAKFGDAPPEEVVRQIREPWPTPGMLEAIYRMTWRVLIAEGPTGFWTTDNPVFFFESDGIATREAEVSFPLAPTHALHGCWVLAASSSFAFWRAPERFVREVNRRLASTTERLAFSDRLEDWMMPTLQKRNPYLSRFRW